MGKTKLRLNLCFKRGQKLPFEESEKEKKKGEKSKKRRVEGRQEERRRRRDPKCKQRK